MKVYILLLILFTISIVYGDRCKQVRKECKKQASTACYHLKKDYKAYKKCMRPQYKLCKQSQRCR